MCCRFCGCLVLKATRRMDGVGDQRSKARGQLCTRCGAWWSIERRAKASCPAKYEERLSQAPGTIVPAVLVDDDGEDGAA
jgi:hypothetical protein